MKKYNVVIVGCGSRYTPGILRMLVSQKERFPIGRLVLYDIEKDRQEKIGQYGDILFKEYYPELDEFIYTTDKEEAYKDLDFAFVQIRAGRLKMREQDEKIALRHNCIGQETCGPGGFAYGMRSVPAMIEIIKDIRKYSKDAWILNYSNPAAIVAEATKRVFEGDEKIINICDMPVGIMASYAKILGLDYHDLEPRYFGLNHFGWFTNVLNKETGEDYLPKLREILKTPQNLIEEGSDQSWKDTFTFMSKMIKDSDEYLPNTYLQYYLYPEHILKNENPEYTRANEVMDGNEKQVHEMCDKVIELGKIKGTEFEPDPNSMDGHAGYIVDLAYVISHNTGEIFLCMHENNGTIENLSSRMMLESPVRVGLNGVEPLTVGPVKTFYKGLLENQYTYEKLTVDANLEGSYQKAVQALTLNRVVDDFDKAKELLDDYIKVNKDYWPELN
ncbi:MAG: 6-phospho-alpha-glucosidase [Anaerococcus vaginalis]|uniref:family 4 glycosyl hydrolase n=1 Tax=Anaerococcus vaginalis TaxID=33037 RepID=UPI00290F40D8|nr:6-phospho-alpha-glucosidase [Anaerococcus vaginalis]MDU7650223.1 6-phospho-alpha-glucosidase [Anaerococcus vaginalis]